MSFIHADPIVFTIFLIFTGGALAILALWALRRRSVLVAYIVLGMLRRAGLVKDTEMTRQVAETGIMFLLFLLGLDLYPQKLVGLFRETMLVTGARLLLLAALGFVLGWRTTSPIALYIAYPLRPLRAFRPCNSDGCAAAARLLAFRFLPHRSREAGCAWRRSASFHYCLRCHWSRA